MLDTLLFVWVYTSTGRSILTVLVFYGMMNFTGELLGISAEMCPFVVSGHAVAAGAVVVHWHRRRRASASSQRAMPTA